MHITDKSSPTYETDFYAWTQQQAKFLKEEKWSCLDIPNLVEEIESLGRQERRELKTAWECYWDICLSGIFNLKVDLRSWLATIREQRSQVLQLLDESPSLQPDLPEALKTAYRSALNLAVSETSLSYKVFPQECTYSLDQVLNSGFFPGEQSDFDEERE